MLVVGCLIQVLAWSILMCNHKQRWTVATQASFARVAFLGFLVAFLLAFVCRSYSEGAMMAFVMLSGINFIIAGPLTMIESHRRNRQLLNNHQSQPVPN